MADARILLANILRHILLALYASRLETLQRVVSFELDNGRRGNGAGYSYNDNPAVHEISLSIFVCDSLGVLNGATRVCSLDSCLPKLTCYHRLLHFQAALLSST